MDGDIGGWCRVGKLVLRGKEERVIGGEFYQYEDWEWGCGEEEMDCAPDHADVDNRTNWSGAALATFYSAVRQALVVSIILRALATGITLGGVGWWLFKRFSEVVGGEL